MFEPCEEQLLILKTDPLESENCKPISVTPTLAKTNVELFFPTSVRTFCREQDFK